MFLGCCPAQRRLNHSVLSPIYQRPCLNVCVSQAHIPVRVGSWSTGPVLIKSLSDFINLIYSGFFLCKSFSVPAVLGVHSVSLQQCNSNLGHPDLSVPIMVIEEQKLYVRRRSTQSVILISLPPFCFATLLMEQETAVVCGVKKQLRQSGLWVRFRSTLSRNIITRRGQQTSAPWFTATTILHI